MALKFVSTVMKVGNSLCLVLPKPLCDGYGIKKGDALAIFAEDNGVFIPAPQKKETQVERELAKRR